MGKLMSVTFFLIVGVLCISLGLQFEQLFGLSFAGAVLVLGMLIVLCTRTNNTKQYIIPFIIFLVAVDSLAAAVNFPKTAIEFQLLWTLGWGNLCVFLWRYMNAVREERARSSEEKKARMRATQLHCVINTLVLGASIVYFLVLITTPYAISDPWLLLFLDTLYALLTLPTALVSIIAIVDDWQWINLNKEWIR